MTARKRGHAISLDVFERFLSLRMLLFVFLSLPLLFPNTFPVAVVLGAGAFALFWIAILRFRGLPSLLALLVGLLGLLFLAACMMTEFSSATVGKSAYFISGLLVLSFMTSLPFSDAKVESVVLWSQIFVASAASLGMIGLLSGHLDPLGKLLVIFFGTPSISSRGAGLDANILASLLAIAISLSWVVPFPESLRWGRGVRIGLLVTLGCLLLVTLSRAALISSVTVSLLIVVSLKFEWWGARLIGLAGAFAFFLPLLTLLSTRWLDVVSAGETGIAHLTGRIELWERSLLALKSYPVSGLGVGQFSSVIPTLYPFLAFGPNDSPVHAHHMPAQIGLDLGMPGLILVISILTAVLVRGVSILLGGAAIRGTRGRLTLGYCGALVGVLLHGSIDSTLWLNKPHLILFFIMAMLILLAQGPHERSAPTRSSTISDLVLILVLWLSVSLVAVGLVLTSPLASLATAILGGAVIGIFSAECWKRAAPAISPSAAQ